jgi:hypothetical protein
MCGNIHERPLLGWGATHHLATPDMPMIIGRMNDSLFGCNAGVIVQTLGQELAQIPKPMIDVVYKDLSIFVKKASHYRAPEGMNHVGSRE